MADSVAPLGLLAAVALLWVGCSLVNAPLHMGGPMNLSFDGPAGAVLVACGTLGVALLPGRWQAAGWGLAAAAAIVQSGSNLWAYPPFDDGAYFMVRYNVPNPDRAPAGAAWTVAGFVPVVAGLAASMPPRVRPAPLLAVVALASAVACVLFDALTDVAWDVPFGARLLAVLAGCVVAAVAWRCNPGHLLLRIGLAGMLVLAGLCAVTWRLWVAAV